MVVQTADDTGTPQAPASSFAPGAHRPRRVARRRLEEDETVIAAAVVRISDEVHPGTRAGEGWPRERAGVVLQTISARPRMSNRQPPAA